MNIGKRLKRIREIKGLTQAEMAELLGISHHQTYSRYENSTSLKIDLIESFNKILEIDLLRNDFIEADYNGNVAKEQTQPYGKSNVVDFSEALKTLIDANKMLVGFL